MAAVEASATHELLNFVEAGCRPREGEQHWALARAVIQDSVAQCQLAKTVIKILWVNDLPEALKALKDKPDIKQVKTLDHPQRVTCREESPATSSALGSDPAGWLCMKHCRTRTYANVGKLPGFIDPKCLAALLPGTYPRQSTAARRCFGCSGTPQSGAVASALSQLDPVLPLPSPPRSSPTSSPQRRKRPWPPVPGEGCGASPVPSVDQ